MKLIKKISSFCGRIGLWLIIAITIYIIGIQMDFIDANVSSAIICITFLLLIGRKLLYNFTIWFIEYNCSINSEIKKIIDVWMIIDDNDPNSKSKKKYNPVFFIILHLISWGICIIISLIFWCFPGIPGSLIYKILYSISVFGARLFGNGLQKTFAFLYFILSIGTLCMIVWYIICFVKGKCTKAKTITTIVYVITKHIFNYFFFAYSLKMVLNDILFWIVIFILIASPFIGNFIISKIRNHRHTPPAP